MTDSELLEKAAKAAGYVLTWKTGYCKGGEFRGAFITEKDDAWNPIDDDGDALRLAVKLGIKTLPYPVYAKEKHSVEASSLTFAPPEDDENTFVGAQVVEIYELDPYAATRRAIVRAAAAIGESA
jgi:hypothetical protein